MPEIELIGILDNSKNGGSQMERSTHIAVTFHRPFRLAGVEGIHSPGSYDVETVEEPLDQISYAAFVRISTTITLPNARSGARQVHQIMPEDLAAALKRDKED